jgi:hypothetical protein
MDGKRIPERPDSPGEDQVRRRRNERPVRSLVPASHDIRFRKAITLCTLQSWGAKLKRCYINRLRMEKKLCRSRIGCMVRIATMI